MTGSAASSIRPTISPTVQTPKKVENLEHSLSLYFMYYNFCRTHKTLKGITPAIAAGLTDRRRR